MDDDKYLGQVIDLDSGTVKFKGNSSGKNSENTSTINNKKSITIDKSKSSKCSKARSKGKGMRIKGDLASRLYHQSKISQHQHNHKKE